MRLQLMESDSDDDGVSPIVIDPSSFPDLAHWWRADDLSGILNDGDPVGDVGKEWIDRIASLKAQQSIAGNRPTFLASWTNGKPAVKFRVSIGSQQFLNLASNLVNPATPNTFTMAFVGQFTIISGNPTFGGEAFGNNGTTATITLLKSGTTYQMFITQDDGTGSFAPAWTGSSLWASPHAIYITRNSSGGNFGLYNNSDSKTGSASLNGVITLNQMMIYSAGTDTVEAKFGEYLHYTRILSTAELTSLYDGYIKPRYAL